VSLVANKVVLVSEASGEELAQYVADLALARRALSLPIESEASTSLPNYVELWGDEGALRIFVADWPYPARAWLVAETVPVAYERTWSSGMASPGLRMVSTIHRREGLSRDDFRAHWLGPHTAVAKSYTVPVWHYDQNVVVEAIGHDSGEDGFVGMHFRRAEDLRARWQEYPEEAARGAEDAARFMSVERSLSMTAVETVWADDIQ
jgi:hypothetical protein